MGWTGILERWNDGVLGYRDTEILEWWHGGMVGVRME
jgi:hypothetical protein